MKEVSSAVVEPYDVASPYSICESAASLVVHVMVAPLEVMLDAVTPEIAGATVSAVGGVVVAVEVEVSVAAPESVVVATVPVVPPPLLPAPPVVCPGHPTNSHPESSQVKL